MTAPEPQVTDVGTDDELEAKRDEVTRLREELAQAEAERVARDQAKANSVVARQLDDEADRLKALIAAGKGESPLDLAIAQQEAAENSAEPAPAESPAPA